MSKNIFVKNPRRQYYNIFIYKFYFYGTIYAVVSGIHKTEFKPEPSVNTKLNLPLELPGIR